MQIYYVHTQSLRKIVWYTARVISVKMEIWWTWCPDLYTKQQLETNTQKQRRNTKKKRLKQQPNRTAKKRSSYKYKSNTNLH